MNRFSKVRCQFRWISYEISYHVTQFPSLKWMNARTETFFFFFKDISMKNGILRERGERRGKKKNFILKSEFMFPEESNPFPIVSLFLPRSKLITKGSIKIQIIRKYFWIDILFLFRNQLPLSTVYHYHISPLTILTLPTEEKCSRQTTCFFKDLLKKATTKKTSKRNSPEE